MPLATGTRLGAFEIVAAIGAGWHLFYDVAPDGQRAVVAAPLGRSGIVSSVSVVQHWHREFGNR